MAPTRIARRTPTIAHMPPTDSIAELKVAVEAAARALRDGEPTEPAPTLDRPPKADLGDYSSNAAMLLAGALKDNPRAVAERLRGELEGSLGGDAGSFRCVPISRTRFSTISTSVARSLAARGFSRDVRSGFRRPWARSRTVRVPGPIAPASS